MNASPAIEDMTLNRANIILNKLRVQVLIHISSKIIDKTLRVSLAGTGRCPFGGQVWRPITGYNPVFEAKQSHDGVPHGNTPPIHIPLWGADDLCVTAKFKAIQDYRACFAHHRLSVTDSGVKFGQRGLNQDGIVNWRAYADTVLYEADTCKTQHLRAICLHGEVTEAAGIGIGFNVQLPAECRPEAVAQQCLIDHSV